MQTAGGRMTPRAEAKHPLRRVVPAALVGIAFLLSLALLGQERLQLSYGATVGLAETVVAGVAGRNSSSGATADGAGAGGRDRGGSDAPSAAARPPASCDVTVAPSQWADSCIRLSNACVDQGAIILYDQEHRQTEEANGAEPYLIEPTDQFRKYIFVHRESVSGNQCSMCSWPMPVGYCCAAVALARRFID